MIAQLPSCVSRQVKQVRHRSRYRQSFSGKTSPTAEACNSIRWFLILHYTAGVQCQEPQNQHGIAKVV